MNKIFLVVVTVCMLAGLLFAADYAKSCVENSTLCRVLGGGNG